MCLADRQCAKPMPSSFAPESVVVALAEWVFTDIPAIASYFQRSSMPLAEMDQLLAQLNEPGAHHRRGGRQVRRRTRGYLARPGWERSAP